MNTVRLTKYSARKVFSNQTFILFLAIIAIMIAVGIAFPPFLEIDNILNILVQVATFGIIAIGMSVVMISRGLDLSVGHMVSVCCSAMAMFSTIGVNQWVVCLLGVICAMIMGAFNGFIISRSKAEPFIITLGMMYAYHGLSLIITGGKNVYLPAEEYLFFGRTSLFDAIPIPIVVLFVVALVMFLVLKLPDSADGFMRLAETRTRPC